MTAQELLVIARREKPNVKYATNDNESVIGAWVEEKGRYVPVAGLILGRAGQWGSMEYELLVDGKPLPVNWVEE